jgi:hypothetical protein
MTTAFNRFLAVILLLAVALLLLWPDSLWIRRLIQVSRLHAYTGEEIINFDTFRSPYRKGLSVVRQAAPYHLFNV